MSPQRTEPRGLLTFTIIWLGQLVSELGSGLTGFGLGVYLYQETGSAAQFALNSFFYVLPVGLMAVFSGALADRWSRRHMLILADTGQALAALVIALLLFADRLAVWHIYALTIFSAVMHSFQGPAYQASVASLVPRQHLARAASLAEIKRAVSGLVTPALAGFLVVAIGLEGVLLIDLATFLVALLTLLAVRIPHPTAASENVESRRSLWHDIAFGWRYLRERPGLLGLLSVSFVHDFFSNAALVLIVPMVLSFASADGAGIVIAAGSAGLLLGSLLIGIWGSTKRRVELYLVSVAFNGVALMIAGCAPLVLVIAAGRLLFSFGFSAGAAALRPTLQLKIAPAVQGRVFGMIGALAMLTEAPAYPVAGYLADRIFAPLMIEDGALAGALGPLIGAGPGRGIGLLLMILGVCLLLTALIGSSLPRVRRLEAELADA
jgi:MFS transporter, DHA3 family, macrolide efflux protein